MSASPPAHPLETTGEPQRHTIEKKKRNKLSLTNSPKKKKIAMMISAYVGIEVDTTLTTPFFFF